MHLYSVFDSCALAYIWGVYSLMIVCRAKVGAAASAVLNSTIPITLTNTQAIRAAACAECLRHSSKLSVMRVRVLNDIEPTFRRVISYSETIYLAVIC